MYSQPDLKTLIDDDVYNSYVLKDYQEILKKEKIAKEEALKKADLEKRVREEIEKEKEKIVKEKEKILIEKEKADKVIAHLLHIMKKKGIKSE